jgi:hypothetical protein
LWVHTKSYEIFFWLIHVYFRFSSCILHVLLSVPSSTILDVKYRKATKWTFFKWML